MTTNDLLSSNSIFYILDNGLCKTLQIIGDLEKSFLFFATNLKRGLSDLSFNRDEDPILDAHETLDTSGKDSSHVQGPEYDANSNRNVPNLVYSTDHNRSTWEVDSLFRMLDSTFQNASDKLSAAVRNQRNRVLSPTANHVADIAATPMHTPVAEAIKILELSASITNAWNDLVTNVYSTDALWELEPGRYSIQAHHVLAAKDLAPTLINTNSQNTSSELTNTYGPGVFSSSSLLSNLQGINFCETYMQNMPMCYSNQASNLALPLEYLANDITESDLREYTFQRITGMERHEKQGSVSSFLQLPSDEKGRPALFGEQRTERPYRDGSPSDTVQINLNKSLIENFTIHTSDARDGIIDFKHKVEEVLLDILNSANVIQ